MEVECGVTPPSTLSESGKEAAISDNIIVEANSVQNLKEEVSTFQQSNGVSTELSEDTNAILNESLKTMLANESETSHFVENLEKAVVSSEVNVNSSSSAVNTDSIVPEMNIGSFRSDESIPIPPSKDPQNVKIEIKNEKENFTSEQVLSADDVTIMEGINSELNNIIDSGAESNVGVLPESAEQNTSDLLTQLEGHTEFDENVQEHNINIMSADNNNVDTSQVMNKKELLDILEGNDQNGDDGISSNENNENIEKVLNSDLETVKQIAIQQMNETLMTKKPKSRNERNKGKQPKNSHSKNGEKSLDSNGKKNSNKIRNEALKEEKIDNSLTEDDDSKANRSKELIKVLVEDWSDDEVTDTSSSVQEHASVDTPTATKTETKPQTQSTEKPVIDTSTPLSKDEKQDPAEKQANNDDTSPEKASSPQRRVSRVIKKKVIFDPDNPDTFTSKKTQTAKSKSPQTNEDQKEHPPQKKSKVEATQIKTKEKSPAVKPKAVTQWKKPPPKNNRRLTEVDRLLMDEGAVNMMYQLNTSGDADTPKLSKNIRSKAAFIKKLNEKTPETHEIKFRERKPIKEPVSVKRENRTRTSTSTSGAMPSPAQCDQFESHTADDSVIIRRHSSSSYSSSCLSPRRLSDIDASIPSTPISQPDRVNESSSYDTFSDVFMSDTVEAKPSSGLDKNDCMTLKEKLNFKLSRALNVKRKREIKTEVKPKKLKEKKNEEPLAEPKFEKLSVKFEERVAEVNILKNSTESSTIYSIETIGELIKALDYIDTREDVSVTLLLAECGDLCAGLDLSSVEQHKVNSRQRQDTAAALADAARCLFVCMERHSKFVCAGVEGACAGPGLALLALSDVVLASDRATFRLLGARPTPGVSVLTSHRKSLCRSLVTEMLVFGRQLSASEALGRGLVSRTLWPDRFGAELTAMVRDIAAQPTQMLQLKKRLLGLRNNVEPKSSFLSCLDAERDLLTSYWTENELGPNSN